MKFPAAVVAAMLGASAVSGCGGEVHNFAANPVNYLLTIDQMESPGFTVLSPARAVKPRAGATAAASTAYFRDAGTFALSNGPVDVSTTVEIFPSATAASAQLHADVSARESDKRRQAISTGPLGSEAHADTEIAIAPDIDHTSVIQITLEWRLNNLLNVLVVRGRYGGARLSDALLLAGRQIQNEQQGGAPRITPSPTPRAKPAKSPTPISPSNVASS